MEPIIRSLDCLYPDIKVRVCKLLVALHDVGINMAAFETLRSIERQMEALAHKTSKTFNSLHLFGLAVDIWPVKAGKFVFGENGKDLDAWYFKNKNPVEYTDKAKQAGALGMRLGFTWGGDWDGDGNIKDQTFYDLVHFEDDYDIPIDTLHKIYIEGGLNRVWKYVDDCRWLCKGQKK